MPKLITHNSQMQCTLGAKPSGIQVTSQTFSKIEGALIATEGDKAGMVNVPTFGTCKRSVPPPSCVPAPQLWQKTAVDNSILGNKKLTQDSFCLCSQGGRISFVDTGNNTFVDGE